MLRSLFCLGLVAGAVNAQLADFISRAIGSVQQPLVRPSLVAEKNTRVVTSDNWRSAVNVTVDPTVSDRDAAQEWLWIFTQSNFTSPRNVTFWDGVYNETVSKLATRKTALRYRFGRVDCATPESAALCNSFFMAKRYIPVFYHIATYYVNGSTEIRQVPWDRNVTLENQPKYLASFVSEGRWKNVTAWTGPLNPIDGSLKTVAPYLGLVYKYYELLPQWAFMLFISLMGRQISQALSRRVGSGPKPSTARPVQVAGDAT